MQEYVTDAIVLKKDPLGDLDGRYTLFTKRFGKIMAKAKSSRKITSKLAPHLEPGTWQRCALSRRRGLSLLMRSSPGSVALPLSDLHFLSQLLPDAEPEPALWDFTDRGEFVMGGGACNLGMGSGRRGMRDVRRKETVIFLYHPAGILLPHARFKSAQGCGNINRCPTIIRTRSGEARKKNTFIIRREIRTSYTAAPPGTQNVPPSELILPASGAQQRRRRRKKAAIIFPPAWIDIFYHRHFCCDRTCGAHLLFTASRARAECRDLIFRSRPDCGRRAISGDHHGFERVKERAPKCQLNIMLPSSSFRSRAGPPRRKPSAH